MRVLVLGASGFVGSAVVRAVDRRGGEVRELHAPRFDPVHAQSAVHLARTWQPYQALSEALRACDVVVNAAGLADANSADERILNAANAAMPAAVARLTREAGVRRLVHISSAAVQGRRGILDATAEMQPFSAYSRSKALGEALLRELKWDGVVIYRPQGVHAESRRATQAIAHIARSRYSSVAGPGRRPTPQALLNNVADAAAFLALKPDDVPGVVIHPWEGLSTSDLLTYLGGKRPRHIPPGVARSLLRGLTLAQGRSSSVAAASRRLEVLWFGQEIGHSWLTDAGWRPVDPVGAWAELGRRLRAGAEQNLHVHPNLHH